LIRKRGLDFLGRLFKRGVAKEGEFSGVWGTGKGGGIRASCGEGKTNRSWFSEGKNSWVDGKGDEKKVEKARKGGTFRRKGRVGVKAW